MKQSCAWSRWKAVATLIVGGATLIGAGAIAAFHGAVFFALASATLVSEDLTCIAAGMLIRRGELHWLVGIVACAAGICAGDLALFLVGRALGGRLLSWRVIGRRITATRCAALADWFDTNPGKSVFTSRFTPGLRLPGYFAVGALGRRPGAFVAWTFWAVTIWTPTLILCVVAFGDSVAAPLRAMFGAGWFSLVFSLIVMWVMLRLLMRLASLERRAMLVARVSVLWRWEFWPSWLFYLPLLPHLCVLGLRHRGLLTVTAVNPGMPHSGFVGESKHEILARLGSTNVLPHVLIGPGSIAVRMNWLLTAMEREHWSFPLILKPDAGQRGAGVRVIRSAEQACSYLTAHPQATIAQVFHPGPFEAGVFYYRLPGEARGRIFSITDKEFPLVAGDGKSTIAELVWSHPRYRMQAAHFLSRHAAATAYVPAVGELFPLANSGNHCQGTLFRDGAHLITPQLEHAVDEVAQRFDGFFFGRFDVRYSDAQAFREGRDLAIIELNGVTSESTNIYDPNGSLANAYRTLARQWTLAFAIGDANRKRGIAASSWRGLLNEIVTHYRQPARDLLAD